MPCFDWSAQLQNAIADLAAVEAGIAFLMTNQGIEEYDIDTSQSKQTVKRANLDAWRKYHAYLESRVATLDARVNGCGVTHVRPAF